MNFSAQGIVATRNGRRLLDEISLDLKPGELHALLGANGAGKSTLLRVMAGEIAAEAGAIRLNERTLNGWNMRERACLRAVLPQFDRLQTDFTAQEVVKLGRTPCWEQTPAQEQQLVMDAMTRSGSDSLAARRYLSLSGGERARAQMARVLAQISGPLPPKLSGLPRYLLLDEPTASLDLAHRHACLRLARQLADEGFGVLVILHDPDLALRYADRATILKDGRCIGQGEVVSLLTEQLLQLAYGLRIERIDLTGRERPVLLL